MRIIGSSTLSLEERAGLADAVRASVLGQILTLVGAGIRGSELVPCPACGERAILLDEPRTYTLQRGSRVPRCRACAAARALDEMLHPEADIGGEGGG